MINDLEECKAHGHQVLREMFGEKWQKGLRSGNFRHGIRF
jgi:hypothetical protein